MDTVENLILLKEGEEVEEGFLKSLVGQRVLMEHYISKEPINSLLIDGDELGEFKGILFEAFGRGKFYERLEGENIPGICTTTWREKNGILIPYHTDFIEEVKTDSELFHDEYIRYIKHDQILKKVGL